MRGDHGSEGRGGERGLQRVQCRLTDKMSFVTSHVVKNALRGVKGAVKERLAKNEK